ncbi:hypothetical protein J2S43_001122 [Catenuloplanes nepalensis]|uniref:SH3 domain-containing protein n=1 Tax=Catenuloplanes nepalensis TaxID=587533 RepID=A0ABT9MMI6_9ACTN|nr:SH3 domain-containing protein [Catenuloplanes nepalensis]MDP9792610.1 hypothetical protein [Catenuloplanes nepalensis]
MKLTAIARRAALAVTVGLPLLAGPVVAASPAAAQPASQTATALGASGNTNGTALAMAPRCGWQPSASDPYSVGFSGAGIRLRSGPSTTCTVLGLGYAGESVTFRCGAVGDDGWAWDYVRNNTTGVSGFVRSDGLTGTRIINRAC